MSIICPSEITNGHRTRKAVGYMRQSTDPQVLYNTGSRIRQENQLDYARAWGWPEDLIELEDDLGITGTSAELRPGWTSLLQRILNGEVGLILASDVSRLSRSASDFETLITVCRTTNTLIAIDGQILSLKDSMQRLIARFKALLAQFDGEQRTETLLLAKIALARSGVAVTPPPTGYISVRERKDKPGTQHASEED